MTESWSGDHELATWDAAYVLGALTEADRREFEEHLAGCISCREAVDELTAVSPLLSLLDYDHVVAADTIDESTAVPPCPDLLTSLLAKADQRASEPMELQPVLTAATTVDAHTVFPIFRTGN